METQPEQLDHREVWRDHHKEKVLESASELLMPLVEEHPFARWNSSQMIEHIAEETGIARSLVVGYLKNIADSKIPLDEQGSTLHLAVHEGRTYTQVIRPEEQIRDLPDNVRSIKPTK